MKLTVSEVLGFDAFAVGTCLSTVDADLERSVVGVRLWETVDLPADVAEKLVFWPVSASVPDAAEVAARASTALAARAAGLVILTSTDVRSGPWSTSLEPASLPVILLPSDRSPLETIHLVESQLLERVMRVIERADLIHRELTLVAISGGGLDELTETLADLVENPVGIRTMHLEVLTNASGGGEPDEARRRSMAEGRVTRDVQDALERHDFQRRLRSERGPFRIPAIPEVGLRGRVMAPIRIGEARYGYISIAECTRPLGALDMEAVERAALTAALILSQRHELERDVRRLRANFANELIYGNGDRDSLRLLDRRAKVLGFSNELFAVFAVGLDAADRLLADPSAHHHHVDLLLNQIVISIEGARSSRERQPRPLVLSERDGVVVLQPVQPELLADRRAVATHLDQIARDMSGRIQRLLGEGSVWIGIGRPHPRYEARRSYHESRQALLVGRSLQSQKITYYEDLGLYRLFIEHADPVLLHGFAQEQLGSLLRYDDERRGELVRTLRLYLDSGGNKARTASLLPSHLNTVKYRLQQIREITGRDPEDPEQQLSFRIALKIIDLHG